MYLLPLPHPLKALQNGLLFNTDGPYWSGAKPCANNFMPCLAQKSPVLKCRGFCARHFNTRDFCSRQGMKAASCVGNNSDKKSDESESAKIVLKQVKSMTNNVESCKKINGRVQTFKFSVFIGPRCPWGPIYGSACLSLTPRPFANLTDVTLADEDTNSILTDNANHAFQRNVATQVTEAGGKICNLCK